MKVRKTNKQEKQKVFINIMNILNWKGSQMLFPYILKDRGTRFAKVNLKDLYKITTWDHVR